MNEKEKEILKNFEILPDSSYVRLPTLIALFGISKSTILRAIQNNLFPPPVKLTQRTKVWQVGYLREFIKHKSQ